MDGIDRGWLCGRDGTQSGNLHFTCESPLFKAENAIVPREALSIQAHNVELEQKTVVLPPATGGPSLGPASAVSGSLRALAGPVAPPAASTLVEATRSSLRPGP